MSSYKLTWALTRPVCHSAELISLLSGMSNIFVDQHRNPDIKNRDNLVGQLTCSHGLSQCWRKIRRQNKRQAEYFVVWKWLSIALLLYLTDVMSNIAPMHHASGHTHSLHRWRFRIDLHVISIGVWVRLRKKIANFREASLINHWEHCISHYSAKILQSWATNMRGKF